VPVQPLRHLSWICSRSGRPKATTPALLALVGFREMPLATMLLATSQAVTKDIGLIAVFGGIGLLVNIILVYIAIQIRGERQQNKQYMASRQSSTHN
jgi:hypothetical protein